MEWTIRTLLYLQVFILLRAAVLCNATAADGGDIVELARLDNQKEFDYFVLSHRWPGTVCRGNSRCCSSNACCRGAHAPAKFTIHGLWANYNDNTWPACCAGPKFDIKQISSLHHVLKKFWPFLSCDGESTCDGGKGLFWAHEWEKHGTCSFPVVQNEFSYFVTTLSLYFKYNVTEVLKKASIVPSNSKTYPIGGILSVIQKVFHAKPLLTCIDGDVEELRLCFYKDFKPRDCAIGSTYETSDCPSHVRLPIYRSPASSEFSVNKDIQVIGNA